MTLDIPFLKGQVVSLEHQFAQAVATLEQTKGALGFARQMLSRLEAEVKKSETVLTNGDGQ